MTAQQTVACNTIREYPRSDFLHVQGETYNLVHRFTVVQMSTIRCVSILDSISWILTYPSCSAVDISLQMFSPTPPRFLGASVALLQTPAMFRVRDQYSSAPRASPGMAHPLPTSLISLRGSNLSHSHRRQRYSFPVHHLFSHMIRYDQSSERFARRLITDVLIS